MVVVVVIIFLNVVVIDTIVVVVSVVVMSLLVLSCAKNIELAEVNKSEALESKSFYQHQITYI